MKETSRSSSASARSPLLAIRQLRVDLPDKGRMKRVLDGVDLSLGQGEILGLVGESGCGKSVLARTMMRLEAPGKIVSGAILLHGRELTKLSRRTMNRIRNKQMALVLQNPRGAMDPVFTLGWQFNEVLKAHAGPGRRTRNLIARYRDTLLLKAGISAPEKRCRQYPHQWSRGMLQRALLLMGFSGTPDILILDEVTSALDPTITLQILSLIRQLRERHDTGIIFITHDLFAASAICDRIAVMQKGGIVETGSSKTILHAPAHPYTRTLVSAGGGDIGRPAVNPAALPLIQLENLTVTFPVKSRDTFSPKRFNAVSGVTLSIREGETFCLIGESGSGKTTLMNAILGFQPFAAGTMTCKDRKILRSNDDNHLRLQQKSQVVFQDPLASLNPSMTLEKSLREAVRAKDRQAKDARVNRAAEEVGLSSALLRRKPGKASLGQNQRTCLARALAGEPDLLFLDEPLSALDRMSAQRMVDLLDSLMRKRKITLFVITHDLGFVKQMGTTVAVMYLGRIVEIAPAASFFSQARHPYSEAMLSSALIPGLWNQDPIILEGELPSPHTPPMGCVFHSRCPRKQARCEEQVPERTNVGPGHDVFCHLAEPAIASGTEMEFPCLHC